MVPPFVPVGAVEAGAVLGATEAPPALAEATGALVAAGALVAGGAVVAVEPPQAPRASVATTPMVTPRNHLVSDLTIISSKFLPERPGTIGYYMRNHGACTRDIRVGRPTRASAAASVSALRIQGVPERVTEQVERDDEDNEDGPRDEQVGRDDVEVGHRVGEHRAERRVGWEDADAQERQGGLQADVRGQRERRIDEDRRPQVRKDLGEQDPALARPHGDRGFDELAFAEAEHLSPHDTGEIWPAEDAHHEDQVDDP